MRKTIQNILSVTFAMFVPLTLQAQDDYATMQQAQEDVDQIFASAGAFVHDTRFDEDDVISLIELWEEYNQFGEEYGDDDEDDIIDFESMLGDSEYRRWAASHNLDAEDWMRKTVRISMALYREQMQEAAAMMPGQMEEQLRMIEEQREQLGEELYQQMKQGMEAAAQYGSSIMDSAKHLPEPTASEQALLDQYRDDLMMLMDSGDEDYDEYGEYEDYGDDWQ